MDIFTFHKTVLYLKTQHQNPAAGSADCDRNPGSDVPVKAAHLPLEAAAVCDLPEETIVPLLTHSPPAMT